MPQCFIKGVSILLNVFGAFWKVSSHFQHGFYVMYWKYELLRNTCRTSVIEEQFQRIPKFVRVFCPQIIHCLNTQESSFRLFNRVITLKLNVLTTVGLKFTHVKVSIHHLLSCNLSVKVEQTPCSVYLPWINSKGLSWYATSRYWGISYFFNVKNKVFLTTYI